MANNDLQFDQVQGNVHINEIAGDLHGDLVARDKTMFTGDRNVNILGNLVIYTATSPKEPESKPLVGDIGPNPYKGLSAFQEKDADRFFGREQVTQTLWEKFCKLHEPSLTSSPLVEGVTQSISPPPGGGVRGGGLRLLAILGPSGSGKSSVARAGLLPELARRPLPGREKSRVAVFTPGAHPMRAIAIALARMDSHHPDPRKVAEDFCRRNEHGEWDGLCWSAEALPEIDASPLILLIDQFEEVYSQCEDAEQRTGFIENLLYAASDKAGHVSVILTLRSDFLGQTQSHPAFNHAIAAQAVLIPVMNDAELRQAIAKPAELAGHPLDAATVDLLIEQTKEREGALPLLQFALTQIWAGLAAGAPPAETLKQIGGVGGALAGKAQQLFDRLSAADQAIARRAFLGLIQLGEGARDTRRRISLTEIVAQGEDAAHVQAVVRCFADPAARLVTLSANTDGTETAEVTHEALLDHWGTLKAWLDANRDDLRFHRHLAEDAKYWEAQGQPDGLLWQPPDLDLLRQYHQRAGQDMTPLQVAFFRASVKKEQHSRRVKRLAILAIIILAALSTCAAGVAFLAYRDANAQKAAAQDQARVSLIRSVVAYAYKADAQDRREEAALLAQQAYLLDQKHKGKELGLIEDALRSIFRTAAITEEPGSKVLVKQVCQKVKFTVALTPQEWAEIAGPGIAYEPACPALLNVPYIQLRREKMAAAEMKALSLNVREDWRGWGYPIHYIDNRYEDRGAVIFDDATGLTWQQSGSAEGLTYEAAQAYIEQLNAQKFAGYHDWRLPTVEELLSLLEKEPNSANKLYINPMFDATQTHVWSADIKQIKGEGPSGVACFVGFNRGYVSWSDGGLSVRAVRP